MSYTDAYPMDPEGDLLIILTINDEVKFAPWIKSPPSSAGSSLKSSASLEEGWSQSQETIVKFESPLLSPEGLRTPQHDLRASSEVSFFPYTKFSHMLTSFKMQITFLVSSKVFVARLSGTQENVQWPLERGGYCVSGRGAPLETGRI